MEQEKSGNPGFTSLFRARRDLCKMKLAAKVTERIHTCALFIELVFNVCCVVFVVPWRGAGWVGVRGSSRYGLRRMVGSCDWQHDNKVIFRSFKRIRSEQIQIE
jgi:hypothetical protein